MTQYLKENGFPVDLEFTTPQKYEDKENSFYGFKCDVLVDGHHYDELYFTDYRSRAFYANGFLAAYNWESEGKYKWRGKEKTHRENGDLDVQVGDWIVDKYDKIRKIWSDEDVTLPYEDIIRHATEKEAINHKLINKLVKDLYELKESNRSAWDTYGSELCAGDMSRKEKVIEDKIDKLR